VLVKADPRVGTAHEMLAGAPRISLEKRIEHGGRGVIPGRSDFGKSVGMTYATLFMRLALGVSFLSAVADRFGCGKPMATLTSLGAILAISQAIPALCYVFCRRLSIH
jgi:hypothetical protein